MTTITPQQILVPKKVYIGDAAELRCTFNSPSSALKQLTANGTAEISAHSEFSATSKISATSAPPATSGISADSGTSEPAEISALSGISASYDDYEIKSITLSPAGVDFYQLSLNFVPWKTGLIEFPNLTLEDVTIVFEPIPIVSLVSTDNLNTTSLHDTAAPLLLPGTAYKLYGTLAAIIILVIVLIRLFIKRKSLLFYMNTRRLLKKYKKNKKQTIRALYKIAAEAENSEEPVRSAKASAEKIQKTLRNYLEVRFDFPFTHAATSEIMPGFYKVTGGLLSEQKEEAFGEIAASFVRTDFIRYSNNAAFEKDELKKMIENLTAQIETLETVEKEKSEDSKGGNEIA